MCHKIGTRDDLVAQLPLVFPVATNWKTDLLQLAARGYTRASNGCVASGTRAESRETSAARVRSPEPICVTAAFVTNGFRSQQWSECVDAIGKSLRLADGFDSASSLMSSLFVERVRLCAQGSLASETTG
jgi:hypothetical protein